MTRQNDPLSRDEQDRRAYTAPAIVLELDLETRAGSVLPDSPDLLDLTGVGDSNYLP
jgi:hypothetical protein